MKRVFNAATLAAYLLISVTFFGRSLWNHLSSRMIGVGADPTIYVWFFKWWPYAIWHHLNPLFTRVIYAPAGINVTWTTSIPLAAIVAAPITAIWGPVAAYNLFCLLSPALAAWAAFQLCYYLTRRYWPAFLGGYIFGFSTYMLTQVRGHLVETLIFPIPLIVLVVLRRLRHEISPNKFIASMVLLLLTQFLLSVEQVATMTFFGGIAITVAWLVYDAEIRSRILSIIPQIALSYALVVALLIPYEYFMFAYGFPRGPIWSSAMFSADLVNFVVPTRVNLVGTFSWFETVSRTFAGNVFEDSAFLGWPLIAVALWFGVSGWRSPAARMLLICLVIICVFSMGEVLQISGVRSIWLPWKFVLKLPLMSSALPCRLIAFAFLSLAVITALWLDTAPNRFAAASLAVLTVLCLLPNFDGDYWTSSAEVPTFFSRGMYRDYLKPGDVVWALPPSDSGYSMLWQAGTNMYFRMAEGYVGPDQKWTAEWRPKWSWRQSDQLEFLAYSNVTAIVLSSWMWKYYWIDGPLEPGLKEDADFEKGVASMMSALGITASKVGEIELYRVPDGLIAPFRLPHPEIEARMVSSLVSRVDKALSYAAYCVPQSTPIRVDTHLWHGLNAAASASPSDPYSRDFQVNVEIWPEGNVLFSVTAAEKKYLVRLETALLASSVRPEAMWITSVANSDSFELAINLTRAELLRVAQPHAKPGCDQ